MVSRVSRKAWLAPAMPPTALQESSCTYANVQHVSRAGPGPNGKGVSAATLAAVQIVPRARSRTPFPMLSACHAQRGCKVRKGPRCAASQRAIRANPVMWQSQGAVWRALLENTGRKRIPCAWRARQIQTQKPAVLLARCACALQDSLRALTAHAEHATSPLCKSPSACR